MSELYTFISVGTAQRKSQVTERYEQYDIIC